MSADVQIESKVLECLRTFQLRPSYPNEQTDLQGDLARELERTLGPDVNITKSIDGRSKPNIKLLGTSFWPDIVIAPKDAQSRWSIAIEAKRIADGKSGAKPLEETLGQCLIYRARYTQVLGMVVHFGTHNDDLGWEDSADAERFAEILQVNRICLVLRRPGCIARSRGHGLPGVVASA